MRVEEGDVSRGSGGAHVEAETFFKMKSIFCDRLERFNPNLV